MKNQNRFISIALIFSSFLVAILGVYSSELSSAPRIMNENVQSVNVQVDGVLGSSLDLLKHDMKDYIGLSSNFSEHGLTGQGVTIAVMDTGILPNHEAFTDSGITNWSERIISFYDEDTNGETETPYEEAWHGTWTASIVGGNSTDFQGIAPNVKFVILKVFDQINGSLTSTPEIINTSVNWLIENQVKYNIRVVSMSFGAKPELDNIETIEALNVITERLISANMLVVAASGNYGDTFLNAGAGTVLSPGSAKSVLCVGGVDYNGLMYYQSGKGPTHEGIIKPDVCAPAVNVYGAYPDLSLKKYASASGTSASTPFVAGLAALMLEENPHLTSLQLKSLISLTSYRTVEPRILKDNTQGWGIIQGYAALNALGSAIPFTRDTLLNISLSESNSVYCQPITLEANDYFFELSQTGSAQAEMYLFENGSDTYGNPILLSHSLNSFDLLDQSQRMGFSSLGNKDYLLLIKLVHGSGTGTFQLRLIFEIRLGVIFGLAGINILGMIYIVKNIKNFKTQNRKVEK